MSRVAKAAYRMLSDITHFTNLVTQVPLRPYQLEPLQPIIHSIVHRQGREFLLIFPRQSGKNEAVAQLLVYLLNLFQRTGGNIVYGAMGDAITLGTDRLEERLTNPWNKDSWRKDYRPKRRRLGKAAVTFLSTHPSSTARGQTADWLLVIDETQDQIASQIESVFTPMRAANNATALYIGTVKLTTDYLWQKKVELEREQQDGIQRVFLVQPDQVIAANPPYKTFLDNLIRKHGRHHPIIASEYFLEPIDGEGGLIPERRRRLLAGSHPRQRTPTSNQAYVATLDVAGEDEAATDPIARLAQPGRDYTVATVFAVDFPTPDTYAPGPTYRALDVWVDQGTKHFQDQPGRPALVHQLKAWLDSWHILHLIADDSGIGQGLTSWLTAALGPHRVTGFTFSPTKKAALGSAFLSLIETGRCKHWTDDADDPLSDGWWFWKQAAACSYDLPPDGQFDKALKWGVPANHKTDTPTGRQLTHDDRLISFALIAHLDRLYLEGKLTMGLGLSEVAAAPDPLGADIY